MDKKHYKMPEIKRRIRWPWFLLGKEKEYVLENLSHLIGAGLDVLSALRLLRSDIKSNGVRECVNEIISEIEGGSSLWSALNKSRIFPPYMAAVVKIGEESGKLEDNLKVLALQDEKDRNFRSQVQSAMMYPIFVFSFTLVVGLGVAWFILPRLATVFSGLRVKVPWITELLINFGRWLGIHGAVAVPAILAVGALLMYIMFFFPPTKFIGQYLLFGIPVTRDLLMELELSRFGYLLGTLLNAGIPIDTAVHSLAEASVFPAYKKIYLHLENKLDEGDTIQKSLNSFPNSAKYIPMPVQGMIAAGEQSGTIPDVLLKIGETFSLKTETTAKNLTTLIEPVLLIIVWFGVIGVALAVFLPIYNLIGGIGKQISPAPSTTIVKINPVLKTTQNKETIKIIQSYGFMTAVDSPTTSGRVIRQVKSGEILSVVSKKGDWFEVRLSTSTSGWIFDEYAEIHK